MTTHDDKAKATKWLNRARNPTGGGNADYLNFMEEERRKAGTSYEDIGTTAEEVAALYSAGYKAEAVEWLNRARNTNSNINELLTNMEESLQMGGARYEDIGTSAEEVAALRKRTA